MFEWIANFVATVPPQAWVLVPIVAFLESCLFVGLFVSGIFLLSIVSVIYAQGYVGLPVLVALSFAGALVGDQMGYYIGRTAAPLLWRRRVVRRQLVRRKRAYRKYRALMNHAALPAVCLGRLSPPIRSIAPVLAGVSGVAPGRFLVYDLVACALWAGGLAALAYGAGQMTS